MKESMACQCIGEIKDMCYVSVQEEGTCGSVDFQVEVI